MPWKADIFDLDGTLLDSMEVWEDVGTEFLRQAGVCPPPDLNDRVRTMSFRESSEYFISTFHLSATVEEIMAYIYGAVAEKYRHTLLLKPYAAQYIRHRKKQGVQLCVATATNQELACAALERCGVLQEFAFVLSCDEVGAGKDDPAIFLQAARRLGVRVSEACVYEDSLHCIRTAKAAGFATVGVYDRAAAPFQQEIQALSDRYITTFSQLL